MQSAAWSPQIAILSTTHRVIAIDMPGHGGSSALPTDAPLEAFVEWLHAVLVALEIDQVSLVGHSMGALVAAGYAVNYPDALVRVALLNGVYRRCANARAAVEERAEQIRKGAFDLDTPLARWFGNSPIEISARADVANWLSKVDLDGYATAYGAFARGDEIYADQLGDIRCPFLVITGGGDLNSTPDMARKMANEVPDGQVLVINNHRHMVNLTAPEQVNAALLTWMKTTCKGVPT
jgi:pimeloyl-ACP methyl ester carboxylesterase